MPKKAKFKLSSFIIEKHLIFFSSSNKNNKTVAFAIFKTAYSNEILPILNQMYKKRYFEFFSWQISIYKEVKHYFLICFKDSKNGIIKSYNMVYEELKNYHFKTDFVEDKALQNLFFKILSKNINSKISINQKSRIIIKNHNTNKVLEIYELNLEPSTTDKNLFKNLMNYFIDIGKKINIIFNFHINNLDVISSSAILIEEILKDKKEELDAQVNQFFNQKILIKKKLKFRDIMLLLWRDTVSSVKIKNSLKIYTQDNKIKKKIIYNQLLDTLKEEKLNYHKINREILLVEDKVILFLVEDLKLKILTNLFQRYYPKYKIVLIFLNDKDFSEITNIDLISKLKDLKIMKLTDLKRSNYKIQEMI